MTNIISKILIVVAFLAYYSPVVAFSEVEGRVGMLQAGKASWYSVESTKREGTYDKYNGRMANGKIFDDTKMVAASWDYKFGTLLRVTNLANKKSVIVKVTDKGPAKKLYKKGRKIDLSKAAFSKIASLKQGIIEVEIEETKGGKL